MMESKMIKDGLLVEPNFEDIESYLNGGTRTIIMDEVAQSLKQVRGTTDGLIVKNIIVSMHTNTERLDNGRDERKFKRNSSEILESGVRTGCCDSCTLFTSIARSAGIPTMQIITLSKNWGKDVDRGKARRTDGHFYAGVFLKDIDGNSSWYLVDPDRKAKKTKDIDLTPLNVSNRNIGNDAYIFAYVKDYFDDLGIDSKSEMARVQLSAYKQCNKSDMYKEEREI